MADDDRYIDFGKTVEQIEEHLDAVPERILAYYDEAKDPPNDYCGLEDSPSQLLVEDASDLVEYELARRENKRIGTDSEWSSNRTHYIHLAIGVELLLNAFVLESNPQEYVERLKENNSPSIRDSKQKLYSDLTKKLSNDQMKRLNNVLELLYIQRNNAVHTGFHEKSHYAHTAPVYEVLQFLFECISKTHLEVIQKLGDTAAAKRDRQIGKSTKPVKFPVGKMN